MIFPASVQNLRASYSSPLNMTPLDHRKQNPLHTLPKDLGNLLSLVELLCRIDEMEEGGKARLSGRADTPHSHALVIRAFYDLGSVRSKER